MRGKPCVVPVPASMHTGLRAVWRFQPSDHSFSDSAKAFPVDTPGPPLLLSPHAAELAYTQEEEEEEGRRRRRRRKVYAKLTQ